MTSSASVSPPVNLGHRRIFITGGTGFVGRGLLDYLAECADAHGADFEVVVLSRDPAAFLRRHARYASLPWLTFQAGDVDRLDKSSAQRAGRFTDVLHAASEARSAGDPVDWMRQIVDGTRQSLQFATNTGARRYLFASSGAVYGPQPQDLPRIPETHPGAPSPQISSSAYGQAKRLAEQLCTAFMCQHGLETVAARYFALVGPHVPLDGGYAIGNFIRDALAGRPIRVASDGRAVRSYLYSRDCAHWTFTLLAQGEKGEAFNVGSDDGLSIADLARRVANCLSPGSLVEIEHDRPHGAERSVYVPDISKAAALGLKVETSLDAAIRLSAGARAAMR